MARTDHHAPPAGASNLLPTIRVGGLSVAVRAGRVWLHDDRAGDGDLRPGQARALGVALLAAADHLDRRPAREAGAA